jgi:hypothetical protein
MSRFVAVLLLIFAFPLVGLAEKTPDKPIADPQQFEGESREAYELAVKYAEVIKGVKCHCGCMNSLKHKGLHTCFETDHSSHCVSCRAEMFRVAELKKQGKSNKEISKQIDKEFAKLPHQH